MNMGDKAGNFRRLSLLFQEDSRGDEMDFVSERTIGGKSVVWLEEVLEHADDKRINLLLKSGALQIFERIPAGLIEPGSIEERELAIEHSGKDLSDDAWNNLLAWPDRLQTISAVLYWVLMRSQRLLPNVDGFGRDRENPDEYVPEDEVEYSELRWGKHQDTQNVFYLHGALPIFDTGVEIIKEVYDKTTY